MKYRMIRESVDGLWEEVKQQPFFKKYAHSPLLHGTSNSPEDIQFIKFRFRDKPRDTYQPFHDSVNELSNDVFGVPIRSLLFTSKEFTDTQYYGEALVVVPKESNYKLFHNSEVSDMTNNYNVDNSEVFDVLSELAIDQLVDVSDEVFQHEENVERFGRVAPTVLEWCRPSPQEFHDKTIEHIKERMLMDINAGADSEDTQREIEEINNDSWMKAMSGKYKDSINRSLEHMVEDYVEGVDEVIDVDDIVRGEVMVYAPDGFYAIPVDLYDELLKDEEDE